jgi:hypothetical protein
MKNVNRRIQQISLTLLTTLSLLASSVAACTCSHHQAEIKPEIPACHQHPEMAEMADRHGSAVENTSDCLAADDDCFCAENSRKIIAKFEAVKLKKHVTTVSIEVPVFAAALQVHKTVGIAFAKPSYLSDSFYNLAPKRGPPSL